MASSRRFRQTQRRTHELAPTHHQQKHLIIIPSSSLKTDDDQSDAKLGDSSCLASYSWLARGSRTIIVPGCPPRWSPPVDFPHLQEDRGIYFRDKNASQYPDYPTEPSVRAILLTQPRFDGQNVDLFACSNTISSLRALVQRQEKNFRFAAEKVGHTLFLTRRENSPDEVIEDIRGYGHTFPEVYTTWDTGCTGSQSHHRLVSSNLGDLRCIIRAEADGYLPEKLPKNHVLRSSPTFTQDTANATKTEDLMLPSISDQATTISNTSALTVHRAGHGIPQDAIFDIKTRSIHNIHNPINMEEVYARAWANSIPNFIHAQHDRGRFDTITVNDVSTESAEWETNHRDVIAQLIEIIHTIDVIVEKQSSKRVEVRREGRGDLQVWTDDIESNGVLPEELAARWQSLPAQE